MCGTEAVYVGPHFNADSAGSSGHTVIGGGVSEPSISKKSNHSAGLVTLSLTPDGGCSWVESGEVVVGHDSVAVKHN